MVRCNGMWGDGFSPISFNRFNESGDELLLVSIPQLRESRAIE